MFQLQLADPDVTNGTIAVSWCLDHEILKELADEKVSDPQVVIVVAPVDNYHLNKEYRKVVPLKDLMTYIEFRSAGKNKIWGLISHKSGKKAVEHYMEKNEGEFHSNVLSFDGDQYASRLRDAEDVDLTDPENPLYKSLSQPLTVTVPKAVFAKEPKQWEKTWVNHFFRDKVIDQCEFRRRRLFAYGVQPFIMLGNLFLRLFLTIFAVSTLCRGLTLQYLLHPLTYSLKDTFDLFEEGSLAIRHLPEDDASIDKFPKPGYFVRSFWSLPLMPLIMVPLLYLFLSKHYVGASILSGSLIGVVAIVLLIAFLANHAKMLKAPFTKAWKYLNEPSEDLWYLNQDEVEIIVCNQDKQPLTYKNLPANRKTARLRFQILKSKVCKPFSL